MKSWIMAIFTVASLMLMAGCESDPITTGEAAAPTAMSGRSTFSPATPARP